MYSPAVVRVDTRGEEPVIQEVNDHIPNEKRVAVRKQQAQFRFDCLNGNDHPLQIEVENYILVTVARRDMDTMTQEQSGGWSRYPTFSGPEMDFILAVQRMPEVEWAVDNSFDGLYIAKQEDYATFKTQFRFAVYMKEEQATFWKLKFNGR